MIKLKNLDKYYNKNQRNEYHVINDISYDFAERGLYVFFGPSGCGKTTLLNVIGCLDKFDSGSIIFEDLEVKRYVPKTADEIRNELIGYIFQNYNLMDDRNVYDNVEIVLDMMGNISKDEKERRITECLQAVGLYKKRKRNVIALSGGERQRVAIARALAKNPKVILADEPTGNLDSNNTFEIMNIIKKISKDRLVILVSHEKDLVDYYADTIIELKDGKIVDEIKNDKNKSFSHSDQRNIYLKDYKKDEIHSKALSANIYSNEKDSHISFDIIFKDGIVYIKTKSDNKVHVVDQSSEIRLLDQSEKEFIKEKEEMVSDFSITSFKEDTNTKKKSFIPLSKGIRNGFKTQKYIKTRKFSFFALIVSSIVLSFLITSLSSILTIKKTDYKSIPDDVVLVEIKNKDERNNLSSFDVINMAKTIDGYESFQNYYNQFGGYGDYTLSVVFARFYQTEFNSQATVSIFAEKQLDKPYTLLKGNKVQNVGEIVISKYIADELLNTKQAKTNGYTSYDDLIDMDSITRNTLAQYDAQQKDLKIVGISNVDAKVAYMLEEDYVESESLWSINEIYISCKDKEKMISELSKTFSSVKDPNKNAFFNFFKKKINEKSGTLITLVIMLIAIFIYLSLLMRASLFNRIKEIGILRSIGATKKDISSIFNGEIIALTTKTSAIAYLITYLIIQFYSTKYSLEGLGFRFFNADLATFFIGIFLIYFVNYLSSTIPVHTLMRKTPVEIIKKYDI